MTDYAKLFEKVALEQKRTPIAFILIGPKFSAIIDKDTIRTERFYKIGVVLKQTFEKFPSQTLLRMIDSAPRTVAMEKIWKKINNDLGCKKCAKRLSEFKQSTDFGAFYKSVLAHDNVVRTGVDKSKCIHYDKNDYCLWPGFTETTQRGLKYDERCLQLSEIMNDMHRNQDSHEYICCAIEFYNSETNAFTTYTRLFPENFENNNFEGHALLSALLCHDAKNENIWGAKLSDQVMSTLKIHFNETALWLEEFE